MKKIALALVLNLLFVSSAIAQTVPTAQKVIDNYIAALGGKAKLESVNSISMKNSIAVQGMELEGKTIKLGNKFKTTQSFMGMEMVQLFDGEKGFVSQMGQTQDFPQADVEKMKNAKIFDALSMDANILKTVTNEKIDGKDYYLLSNDDKKLYFDAATGLLYRSIEGPVETTIDKYTDINGIKFPELLQVKTMGQEATIKNSDIVINSGVSDADFK